MTPPDRSSCVIRNWPVFGPGYWKKTLYTPAMVARIAANFARLKSHLTPTAKLGHDRSQRLAKSLGFGNVGRVVGVRVDPRGRLTLDLVGVPVAVGGEIAAGRINSGSVELVPRAPDPDDPSEEIDGPILTGVALLGEEQPALKGFPPPIATFEDGSPVPPAADASRWLEAMAEVMAEAATFSEPTVTLFGRTLPAAVLCFSDMETQPVDVNSLIAALQALPPDQQSQVLAAVTPAPAVPAAPPPEGQMSGGAMGGDDGSKPPAYFAAFAEDCKKRFAALEKSAEDSQKEKDAAADTAFSEMVDRRVKAIERKVAPVVIEKVVKPTALGILKATNFSDHAAKLAAFSDYFDGFDKLPDDPSIAAKPGAPVTGKPRTDLQRLMLRPGGLIDREYPETAKKLRTATA